MLTLELDLLVWVAAGRRSYGETIEAWRSSCPRLTVWEDALAAGRVRIVPSRGTATVELTSEGEAALSSSRAQDHGASS